MHIALIAPPWYSVPPSAYGGIEAVIWELAGALVRSGQQVTLLAAGVERREAAPGVLGTMPTIPEPAVPLWGGDVLGGDIVAAAHTIAVRRALRELEPDIVHDHSISGLAVERDVPWLHTVHGALTPATRMLLEQARHISPVAISQHQASTAPEVRWAEVVYNGLDVQTVELSTARGDDVLFLGRMSPDKGADLAVDICRKAGRRLILAGKCIQPDEVAWFEAVMRPKLGSDVEWVGEIGGSAKAEAIASCACLLLPLRWHEPFGMVLIEAMAAGAPVLARPRGAIPEVVASGTTGLVAESCTELAEALASDLPWSASDCRDHVAREFSAEKMAAGYLNAYRTARKDPQYRQTRETAKDMQTRERRL